MDSALHFRGPLSRAAPCVGIFDSGVGGLSVLKALHAQWPEAPLLYVADSGHAPYGERDDAYVIARSRHIMRHLMDEGAIGMVIACNTATTIAAKTLRGGKSALPIVGVEPGVKPAVAATRNGRIGVMATTGTLASEKFKALVQAQCEGVTVVPQPCPGLVPLIEAGDLDSPALHEAIAVHTAPLRAAGVDTVVLGCTHYPFVRHLIEAAMGPGVKIIDTSDAVARHAVNTMRQLLPPSEAPPVRLRTTGDVERLRAISRAWLPFACTVDAMPPTLSLDP